MGFIETVLLVCAALVISAIVAAVILVKKAGKKISEALDS